MNVSLPMIGVNGEGTATATQWRHGPQAALLANIVDLVDDTDTTGIAIQIGELTLVDDNDGKSATSSITWTGHGTVRPQREHVARQLTAALEAVTIEVAGTPLTLQQKADAANSAVDRVETALPTMSAEVRAYLRANPLSIEDLIAIGRADGLTDQALINRCLELTGANPAEFQTGMFQAFTELETLLGRTTPPTLAELQANTAFITFAGLPDEELTALLGSNEAGHEALIRQAITRAHTLIDEGWPAFEQAVTTGNVQAIQANPIYQLVNAGNETESSARIAALFDLSSDEGAARLVTLSEAINVVHRADQAARRTPEQALTARGIDFTAIAGSQADSDNTVITADELTAFVAQYNTDHPEANLTITPRLFDLIDRGMHMNGAHTGTITQEEFNAFIGIVGRYAALVGTTFDAAVAIYLNPETQFSGQDLDALEGERSALAGRLGSRTTTDEPNSTTTPAVFNNEATLQQALISAGVSDRDIVAAVIAQINGAYPTDSEHIATLLTQIVFSACSNGACRPLPVTVTVPTYSGPLTPTGIQCYLCGSDSSHDVEIIGELRTEIFNRGNRRQARQQGDQIYTQAAQTYINGLMTNGQVEKAERALMILADPSIAGESAELQINNIEDNAQIHYLMASAYCSTRDNQPPDAFALGRALYHASRMRGSAQTQQMNEVLATITTGLVQIGLYQEAARAAGMMTGEAQTRAYSQIAEACLQAVHLAETGGQPVRADLLDIAYEIARDHLLSMGQTERLNLLSRIAQGYLNCREVDDQQQPVREKALEVLRAIASIDAGYAIQTPTSRQLVPVGDYITQTEDTVRMPLNVLRIRDLVFPPGSETARLDDPNTEINEAQDAIRQLEAIVDDSPTPSTPEEKAYAYLALAQIFRAQGKTYEGQIPHDGQWRSTQCYGAYELAAQCARQATELFQTLRTGSAADNSYYYTGMIGQSNGVIGQIIADFGPYHLASREGGNDGLRLDGASTFQNILQGIAKYLPTTSTERPSTVTYTEANGQTRTVSSALLKKQVHLDNDQEHGDAEVAPGAGHGVPADISAAFTAIISPATPAAPARPATPPPPPRSSSTGSGSSSGSSGSSDSPIVPAAPTAF